MLEKNKQNIKCRWWESDENKSPRSGSLLNMQNRHHSKSGSNGIPARNREEGEEKQEEVKKTIHKPALNIRSNGMENVPRYIKKSTQRVIKLNQNA